MPAPVRTPRTAWVDAGVRALAGGAEAVRVELLAKELGVTKGGFYWHFRDRQELLEAVLERWEDVMVDQAIRTADRGGGDGRRRLRRLFAAADAIDHGLLDAELAVRDWARRDPTVAARVARVDARRMAYLRPLFAEFCRDADDVEGRCLLVLTLFVGEPLVNPGPGRDLRAAAATRHLLR